ncbi:serine/threonine-protein kinase pim-2-like isoform X4 [Tachysurus fulvidraco]|uniref:serine/threonine-protein kinase pim-2-like isoform X4 n=1 Tax=Tachysurus fulvidraco TaxID=1234273 RepID=UPI001FEDBB11|nr:serine/threonine-protein kinase pim-2-like isoform X4 [Tachysurus fulvidraco]
MTSQAPVNFISCRQKNAQMESTACYRPEFDSNFVVQEHVGKKRNLMEVPYERPEEQLVKRRRSESGEKNVETIKPETNVEASSTVTRRVGEENPLKRKCMDVSQGPEGTGKRRRSETEENYKKMKDMFLKRYAVGRMLGRGGCASVCAGVRKSDGKKVALKIMSKIINDKYITVPGDTRRLPAEVALLELVCKPPRCPYVIELLDWIETPAGIVIVLEKPDHCIDLFEFCRRVTVTENMAKIIMRQVIQAARHCRARGTPIYFPPEWLTEKKYEAEPATVWGLGVLLYSMLCGRMPFNSPHQTVYGLQCFPDRLSISSCSLINWCLQKDPKRRPTLEQVIAHSWVRHHTVAPCCRAPLVLRGMTPVLQIH